MSKTILAKTCRTSDKLPIAKESWLILLLLFGTDPVSLPLLTQSKILHTLIDKDCEINTCRWKQQKDYNIKDAMLFINSVRIN